MTNNRCEYADNVTAEGICMRKRCRCNGCGDLFALLPDAADPVEFIERKHICKEGSLFGNYYIRLTHADIDKLLHGECAAILHEEYNVFIVAETEEK